MKRNVWMLSLLMMTGTVCAADETPPDMTKAGSAIANRFYVSPMGTYVFADKDRNSDNGYGGSLVFGKQFTSSFNIELAGTYSRFKGDGGGKEEITGVGLDFLVFPSTTLGGLFGVAGAAYGFDKSSVLTDPSSDKNSTLWNVGIGYLFGPISWLNDGSFRVEARERADEKHQGAKNDFTEPMLSAGLLIPIGAAPVPPPPPAPAEVVPIVAPAPVDSDGDGVYDDKDQCPGTPRGTPVNEVGCPLPPPCKTPEPGQKVDLTGCATGDTIVLRGVNFDFDKATLTANAKTILDGVSDALIAAPSVTVEVGGHTDSKGSDSYNEKLSDRRANTVVKYLEGRGIDAGRMTARGYGETQPVADNDTDAGRELNRRVELKITGSQAAAANVTVAPAVPAPAPAPEATPMLEPAPVQ